MIHIGIGLGIPYCSNAGGLSQFNPIAVARINAIYAAGGSCPVGQATATSLLSDFINAEQSSGRWSQHRNIFIPGWGNAAANAIGIVTGGSGSFPVSGVTHGAGFVQGDGSTGFFNFGTSLNALGLTASQGCLFALVAQADTRTDARTFLGETNLSTSFTAIESQTATQVRMFYGNGILGQGQIQSALSPRSNQTGIFTASFDGTTRRFRVRKAAGVTSLVETAGIAYNAPSVVPMFAMALNSNGSIVRHSDARFGAYGASLITSAADHDAFSANLRTLWQGLFQLSLP